MKKLFKRQSKRGFTLLEVMLATVIMTIVSVMIMKGFLSTLNYAHNNNVYNKMGAKNYADALGVIGQMVSYGGKNGDLQGRIDALRANTSTSRISTGTVVNGHSIEFDVKVFEFDDVGNINIAGGADTSVVSHRHSFFYQPGRTCPVDETHKVRYCEVPRTHYTGWYCREPSCPNYNHEI